MESSCSVSEAREDVQDSKEERDVVIMNPACKLLRQQFPCKKGLQSTLVVATSKCKVLEGGATQILHVRSNHWVCIQVNNDKSLVEVYDSKYKSLPIAAVGQILQLIQSEQDAVTINCKTMQVQEGGDDACGTFATAVATLLWHGENPITKV